MPPTAAECTFLHITSWVTKVVSVNFKKLIMLLMDSVTKVEIKGRTVSGKSSQNLETQQHSSK